MADNKLEELRAQMSKKTTGAFWLALHITLIFAIPAIIGAYVGIYFDNLYETGRGITIAILLVTFASSWAITVIKYKKVKKELKEIEDQIKEEKKTLPTILNSDQKVGQVGQEEQE